MKPDEFMVGVETGQFLFNKSKKTTQTFEITTRMDLPVEVYPLDGLPPGFSLRMRKLGPKEFLVSISYDPFENSKVRLHHVRGTFFLGINYMDVNNFHKFKITLNFEEDDSGEHVGAMHCPICLCKYDLLTRIPLVLACGHTTCQSCLENDRKRVDDLNSKKMPGESRVPFCCCLDKKVILLPVSELPKNFVAYGLLCEEKKKEEKLVIDPFVPCYEDGNHESTKWCGDCKQSFCDHCYDDFHRFRAMSTHTSVPVAEKPIYIPKCSVHPDQNGVFFCMMPDCLKEIVCDMCLSNKLHDGHLCKPLEDIVRKNSQFLKEMSEILSEQYEQLKINVAESSRCHESFKWESKDAEKFRKDIRKYYKRKAKPSIESFEEWRAMTCEKQETENKRRVLELKNAHLDLITTQSDLRRKDTLHRPMTTRSINSTIKRRTRILVKKQKGYHALSDYVFLPGLERCPKLRTELDDGTEVAE